MGSDVRTESSVQDEMGLQDQLWNWLLLDADRRLVAAGIVLVFVGTFFALHIAGLVDFGINSSVARVFGSGLTTGVVTLVTITLSINQLILSRVFGSPDQLVSQLNASRKLRRRIEGFAGEPTSPNDPGAFLSLLARTVSERATTARSMVERADSDPPATVTDSLADISEYGQSIDDNVDAGAPMTEVLNIIIGSEYAKNITGVRHLRNEYGESLPADAREELRVLEELLESVAVVRQFFKTFALQQDFAALSRLLVYSGLVALLSSVALTLVYGTDTVTVAPVYLSGLVPLALGFVIVPLAVFSAYVLRAATVAYRTLSVGPFIPPKDR